MDAAANFLNKAVKPVLVGGVKLRPLRAEKEFIELADACGKLSFSKFLGKSSHLPKQCESRLYRSSGKCLTGALSLGAGYPVAVQPHAKGMFPESHERFIGRDNVLPSCPLLICFPSYLLVEAMACWKLVMLTISLLAIRLLSA